MIYPCSICGRRFNRKANVKVHMAPCVKRNGNPNGVRWDDALRDRTGHAVVEVAEWGAQSRYAVDVSVVLL